MADGPAGTVTFLYADMEGSTRLVQRLGERYGRLLADYLRLMSEAIATWHGRELQAQGDACFAAFSRARDALAAAVAAQRAVRDFSWPEGIILRVRMGIHTGEPSNVGSEYVGIDVNRAARVGAAGYGGQTLLSETTHILVRDHLPEGINLRDLGEYHLKDLAGPQRLFQIVASDLPSDFPPLKSPDRVPNNLPIELSSFVGREREIAEVKRLLLTTRLLTLTGPGGVGKTRLALQIAAEVLKDYKDGVWLVELATCSDPGLVAQMVASALKVNEQPATPMLKTLSDYLQYKRMLLILDNCEHLVMESARLAEAVLRACPDLRVLATSRESLEIAGEASWRVPPLSLPDAQQQALQDLIKCESVRLFVERAVAVRPAFVLTNQNAQEIVQVCQQLDGIPLALELAAARVKGLPVEQIAAKLHDRFRLLTKGSRTALPQHQTLKAAIDWSYNLLSDSERILFRRLAVFSGGFTLEAADAVCAAGDVDAPEFLDLLALLVDKSLVMAEVRGAHARYRLLDTLRQYALDRLLETGEITDLRPKHRDWYLGLAERAAPELFGGTQSVWYERLETEHDNFREALEWSCEHADGDAGLRLAGALYTFWQVRGYLSEGREWLTKVLSRSPEAAASARANALSAAAYLARAQHDYTEADTLARSSLAEFNELGEKRGIARSEYLLGLVASDVGDYGRATGHFNRSLISFRELGDKRGIGISLNMLGDVARCRGEYASARSLYEESLSLRRELGDDRMIAIAIHNLGYVALHQEDRERAGKLFKESLAIRQRIGHKQGVAYCLAGLAAVAAALHDFDRGAKLWGAAETLLGDIGAYLDPSDRLECDRTVAMVRNALGEEKFKEALRGGRSMDSGQAIEYAVRS
jgi:predicted ATPase/class 3 adenylate cyclase